MGRFRRLLLLLKYKRWTDVKGLFALQAVRIGIGGRAFNR